jgi:hypothetical protein
MQVSFCNQALTRFELQSGVLSAMAIYRQCTACICGFGIESDAYDRVLPRPAVVSCLRTSVPLGAGETSRI